MSSTVKIFPTLNEPVNESALRLLFIEDSKTKVEWLGKVLRNSGYSVRNTVAKSPEELDTILQTQVIDLAVCSAAARSPSLEQVREAIDDSGRDVPLIVLASYHNSEMQLEIMQIGASDMVCKNDLDHLVLVVRRELASLASRRKLKVSEQRMLESETRYRTLLDNSREAVTYVHDGMHIQANRAYLELFGFESVESIPIMDMVAPQDHAKFKEFLSHYRSGEQGARELKIRCVRPNDTVFKATMIFAPTILEGEPCTQIIIRGEMEHKLDKKLLSKRDPLTGLYDQELFLEELERVVATQADTSAVLYLETDNTKAVKDQVGNAGCELLLRDIAILIGKILSDAHLAARFGDYTFVLLALHIDTDTAIKIAERVRSAVENHSTELFGQPISVTCSIGIAKIHESGSNAQEVLSTANLACEQAKQLGGNRLQRLIPSDNQKAVENPSDNYNTFEVRSNNQKTVNIPSYQKVVELPGNNQKTVEILSDNQKTVDANSNTQEVIEVPGINQKTDDVPSDKQKNIENKQQWINPIRDALEHDRFTLVYQPIASLHNASEKYEVLIRMQDQEGIEILPGQFIPIAEEHNLITAIDQYVILNAIKAYGEQLQTGLDAMLFIKISQPSMKDNTLLPWLSKLLEVAQMPGDRLVFELLGDVEENVLEDAKLFLQGLLRLRCGICLNRFGSNESIFPLLEYMPAAYLKIDESITSDLINNEENQAFLKAIVEIAQSTGNRTIAHHVEDADSFELLWQAGVDCIHGHFLQQPDTAMNFDFNGWIDR